MLFFDNSMTVCLYVMFTKRNFNIGKSEYYTIYYICKTQSHRHLFILDTECSETSLKVDDNHFIHLQAGTGKLCILRTCLADKPHLAGTLCIPFRMEMKALVRRSSTPSC